MAQPLKQVGARSLGLHVVAARVRRAPPRGMPSLAEHVQFPYRRWDGPIGTWGEHFGKGRGQVHSLDGDAPTRSCNEVEVAKRLRAVGENAYWFSGYNVGSVLDKDEPLSSWLA